MIGKLLASGVLLSALLAPGGPASAAGPEGTAAEGTAADDVLAFGQAVERAIAYLQTKGQASDGSYSAASGPGVTALVTTAILRHGRTADEEPVAKGLEYLEGFVREDGGIYQEDGFLRNYETCLAVLCFSEANRAGANRNGRYDELIRGADRFVKGLQWDEDEDQDRSDLNYGGAGYGEHKRPDMSNTSFLLSALKAAGNGADDEAVQKALVFVSRCQNLETEHNTTEFSAKNPDGGFYYTCAAGGESKAGETPEGGLRSYGSMTYAGLKSMLYAGVEADDPRVEAALAWIQKHYGVDENPGMGHSGLYYYYHVFAKALDATGLDEIEDAEGVKHDWRRDLRQGLLARQRDDGSWINEDSRWMETDPNLVTGYALLALSYCRPVVQED
jgi:squalene-hopene/tetraprenyl-beta-curcumene cyclase